MDKPIDVEPEQKNLVKEMPVVKPTPEKVKPLPNCTLQQLSDKTCKYPFGDINDRPPYLFVVK
jgi:hypothetical protein